jgi:redox-sensitive bicupin YhaK (pirin superfamily)
MSYQDPRYLGWGPIKTINDDRTRPGFKTAWHEHKNLDILNYMIRGECRHYDNIGNDNVASRGQIQHFWCGDSIWHELSNESEQDNRYLQIWVEPNIIVADRQAQYQLINKDMTFGKVPIEFKNTRIEIWAGLLDQNCLANNSYLLVLEGAVMINNIMVNEGDAVTIDSETLIMPIGKPHLILFEMQ